MQTFDLEREHERTKHAAERGGEWVRSKRAELDALPVGTVVVIDVATGEMVIGKTWLEAHHDFVERFGKGTLGYVHRIGERTFIGGGIG